MTRTTKKAAKTAAAARKPLIKEKKEEEEEKATKTKTAAAATATAAAAATATTATTAEENDTNDPGGCGNSSSSIITNDSFASLGVSDALVRACDSLEWKTSTKIQSAVLPEALQGRDVIGLAETGSGKTGAFLLPILQGLLDKPPARGGVSALILTPTRELAFQIHRSCQGLGTAVGVTSACVVGGVDRTSQAICLARHPHAVVATPGRLLDHLKDTKGFHLRHLRYLVLDEADRMLSMDFEQELLAILEELPASRQTMLFSATMTSQVQKLQRASLVDPVRVEVNTKFHTPSTLVQSYLFIPAKYKDCYFTFLVNEMAGQSLLVFGATCNNVQRLALMLRNLGFPAVSLHGQMSQPKRLGALQKFTAGNTSILICTDVASRGLDLPAVDCVINYDLPAAGKEYVHRVGRTARAGRTGKAISLVTQYEVEIYQRLEAMLGKQLPAYATPPEETVLILLERVSEAQRMATRQLNEQLAAAKRNGGGGQRKRQRKGLLSEDGGLEGSLQKELLKGGYGGGSGGRGGALHNQRGSHKRTKKQHHHGKKR